MHVGIDSESHVNTVKEYSLYFIKRISISGRSFKQKPQ